MGSTDILVITKNHESLVCPLSGFIGYQWLSICREEVCASGGVHRSSGVACLIRDDNFCRTSIVHSDTFARFLWVRVDHKSHR